MVPVPGCWENLPDFTEYRGEAVYETDFEAEGTVRLEFKGVSHTASVFVDGTPIARHYNAYTPFSAVVTGLCAGTHTLKVIVDNRFSEASALHIPNDYMTYGGINRAVAAEEIPDVYIRYIHVTPFTDNGTWAARVQVLLENSCMNAVPSGKTGSSADAGSLASAGLSAEADPSSDDRACPG
ncbi:MAG: hypothetical protein IKN57_01355, partial [Parasporobacterium sp.]|nr:hypothetical protein [Parasporobacterium sp.]